MFTFILKSIRLSNPRAKVQLFARSCPKNISRSKLGEMLALAERAKTTYETATGPSYQSAWRRGEDTSDLRLLQVVDAIYHLGQMTLHSKAVPFFSGSSAAESSVPAEMSRNSANQMLSHADSYVKLLKPSLARTQDATCVCPLVGFGAFVAATVFLAVETFAQGRDLRDPRERVNPAVKQERLAALEATISLLDTLRQYWKALQTPVSFAFSCCFTSD